MDLRNVAEELDVKWNTAHTLVQSGQLQAIKFGGPGNWRIARTVFEQYVQEAYNTARANREDS